MRTVGVGIAWGRSWPLGGGGGGRGLFAWGDCVGWGLGRAILGGSGGTGGGGVGDCANCSCAGRSCWRETTGGSLANMSRNIARKSKMEDFCR